MIKASYRIRNNDKIYGKQKDYDQQMSITLNQNNYDVPINDVMQVYTNGQQNKPATSFWMYFYEYKDAVQYKMFLTKHIKMYLEAIVSKLKKIISFVDGINPMSFSDRTDPGSTSKYKILNVTFDYKALNNNYIYYVDNYDNNSGYALNKVNRNHSSNRYTLSDRFWIIYDPLMKIKIEQITYRFKTAILKYLKNYLAMYEGFRNNLFDNIQVTDNVTGQRTENHHGFMGRA